MKMVGSWAHLLPAAALAVASVALVVAIRGSARSDALDRVPLYTYTKPSVSRDAVLSPAGDLAWLSDAADAARCLDMAALNYPSAAFVPGADPTGPSCQILLTAAAAPSDPTRLAITPAYTQASVAGCVPGAYPLEISGGRAGPAAATTLLIAVGASAAGDAAAVSVTVPVAVALDGTGYTAGAAAQWQACLQRRLGLAGQLLNATACQAEASQQCTCVRAFARKLSDPAHRLAAVLPDGATKLRDALLGGVDRCLRLRRAHDVRAPAPSTGPHARTSALLWFALALLLNAGQYAWAMAGADARQRAWAHLAWVALVPLIANGAPGGVEWVLPVCVLLPAALMLAYDLYVELRVVDDLPAAPRAYLHPVAFDVCLCYLNLFTLVERGVAQQEYLIAETFKCHGIAAVYAVSAWYHRQMLLAADDAEPALASAPVDHAHALLKAVALAAAADTLLLPYPAKAPFQPHWLLPLAFTYLALCNPSWAHALLARVKRSPAAPESVLCRDGAAYPFNTLAAGLFLAVGVVLWGHFLCDHLRTFGAAGFRYPDYLSPSTGGLALAWRGY